MRLPEYKKLENYEYMLKGELELTIFKLTSSVVLVERKAEFLRKRVSEYDYKNQSFSYIQNQLMFFR